MLGKLCGVDGTSDLGRHALICKIILFDLTKTQKHILVTIHEVHLSFNDKNLGAEILKGFV